MPKPQDRKRLCPRCGSGMMDKSETVKYCPVCHYTESTKRSEIVIKMDEEEKVEKAPMVEIYRVSAAGAVKVTTLESEFSCVIVDRNSNTLWIWKGAQCSPGDAYKAGVESTRLKSALKIYSANIKRVEEGEEPADFPKIGEELKVIEEEQKRKEEDRKSLQEEARRKAEEEQKRKEQEEQKRLQEEARRKVEEEQKRLQEEERRKAEEEQKQDEAGTGSTGEIWRSVADATKPTQEPVEAEMEIASDEISQAISSLTLVRRINEATAKQLIKAKIFTIMELSLCNPEEVAINSGLDLSFVLEIVGNAKDLLGLD